MAEIEVKSDPLQTSLVPFMGLREGVIFLIRRLLLTFGRPASLPVSEAYANDQRSALLLR
jgi:hypothetical protein